MDLRTRAAFRTSRVSITDWPEMVYRFFFGSDSCQNLHIPRVYDRCMLGLVSTFGVRPKLWAMVETLALGSGSDRCNAN